MISKFIEMRPYFYLVLFTILCMSNKVSAQERPPGQFFISGGVGGYSFSKQIQKEAYGNTLLFEYGGVIGFPVGKLTHIYLKGSYFETSGTHISRSITIDKDGNVIDRSREPNGTSDFQMRRVNFGLQKAFPFPMEFYLLLNGGITTVKTKNRINRTDFEPHQDNRNGWLGFFGGIGIEKRFINSPFSLYIESQYNTTNENFIFYLGDFGGNSYSFGVRFYIPQSKTAFK